MKALSIDGVLSALGRLPTMPAVIMDLISAFADDEIDNESLALKLSRDQALVARVLRVANSPFYGLPRQVATVQEAIMVLGLANVRTLVSAAAIIAQFPGGANAGFDLTEFWRHSIGVACCAKALSGRTGQNPNTAFICGLLHDIGRVLLATSYPAHHAKIAECQKRRDCSWADAEREVIGFDHAEIGAALAARWNFPDSIQLAVAGHHQPDAAGASPLAALTHAGDVICHALGSGDATEFVPEFSAQAWVQLKLGAGDLQAMFAEIERMIAGASILVAGAPDSGAATQVCAARLRNEVAEA